MQMSSSFPCFSLCKRVSRFAAFPAVAHTRSLSGKPASESREPHHFLKDSPKERDYSRTKAAEARCGFVFLHTYIDDKGVLNAKQQRAKTKQHVWVGWVETKGG